MTMATNTTENEIKNDTQTSIKLFQDESQLFKSLLSLNMTIFENDILKIDLKSLIIPGGQMNVYLYYFNNSETYISVQSVTLMNSKQCNDVNIQFSPLNFDITPKQQTIQKCKILLMSPNISLPMIQIKFIHSTKIINQSYDLYLELPVIASKFFKPHSLEQQHIEPRWSQLKHQKQKIITLNNEFNMKKMHDILINNMNMALIREIDNSNTAVFCAVYHFARKTATGQFAQIPLVMRVEDYKKCTNKVRIILRSPLERITKSVMTNLVTIFSYAYHTKSNEKKLIQQKMTLYPQINDHLHCVLDYNGNVRKVQVRGFIQLKYDKKLLAKNVTYFLAKVNNIKQTEKYTFNPLNVQKLNNDGLIRIKLNKDSKLDKLDIFKYVWNTKYVKMKKKLPFNIMIQNPYENKNAFDHFDVNCVIQINESILNELRSVKLAIYGYLRINEKKCNLSMIMPMPVAALIYDYFPKPAIERFEICGWLKYKPLECLNVDIPSNVDFIWSEEKKSRKFKLVFKNIMNQAKYSLKVSFKCSQRNEVVLKCVFGIANIAFSPFEITPNIGDNKSSALDMIQPNGKRLKFAEYIIEQNNNNTDSNSDSNTDSNT